MQRDRDAGAKRPTLEDACARNGIAWGALVVEGGPWRLVDAARIRLLIRKSPVRVRVGEPQIPISVVAPANVCPGL